MAKKIWSSFSTGATPTFDFTQDIFVFDATTPGGATEISAAEITFVQNGANLEMTYLGGKTVTLLNTTLEQLTSSTTTVLGNIRFNDESKLLVGDNTTGTANDNLANTLTGGIGNDQLLGLGGNDNLSGGAGNDLLNGGIGSDIMAGGTGNDTYVVDSSSDSITEAPSAGTDEVQSSAASYTLGTNVEKLTLTGTSNINGTGNTLANTITGNSGANSLNGGTGADTLAGDDGNDTYVVDNAGDQVNESGTGIDTVQSSVNYALGANLENLTLTGTAATGTGNGSDNFITGNASVNTLTGLAGNDTYVVSTGDSVVEIEGGGTDEIWASVSYNLTAAANVENLTLTGLSAINGTGNTETNIIKGNIAANTLDGGAGADTLIGGGGNDTYVVDNAGDAVTEDPSAGTDLVKASVTYTLTAAANVENLTLTGSSAINGTGNGLDNTITGNSAANALNGGLGNDLLNGGAGADALAGGGGDDTYVVDNTGDAVTEDPSAGTDLVQASVSHTLGANVENLTLTGTAANGVGNDLANEIIGNSAANTLNGGVGADTLKGLAGNDTYVVDNAGDAVTELASQGTDLVQASVNNYTLGANVENLTLEGTATNGTGNGLANKITGNTAAGTLTGLAGNDTYVVSHGSTVIVEEEVAGGTDLVEASVSYTLGDHIENLTLTGTSVIAGTGNTSLNLIIGNSAANTLKGGNDALADTLRGGLGNDTYVVDDTADKIDETTGGGGTDLVQASVSYSLTAAANVENLTLTGTATDGTGNTLANTITGTSAANTLDGGTGADTLIGGGGNDTYVVDNAGDKVDETTGGGGTDLVQASVTYTLGANVENLELTGASLINGTGNTLANKITGNGAANILNGGNNDAATDTLIGGLGNDTYVVGTEDVITEQANEGTDLVQASASYTLGDHIENLTLTGTAADGTGNTLLNLIIGNGAANTLNGGNDALADTLRGGLGNDIYVVGANDFVDETTGGGGTDLVQASVTYTLSANVENLELTGAAAIVGTGNTLANIITGNSAASTLAGGAGNDTYVVGTGDTVAELASQGTDLVQASASYTLGDNIEKLTLTGTAIAGTGNALANTITGNGAANTLDGDAGADTLIGGLGADTYVVDNAGDVAKESATGVTGGGIDLVQASVSYTLGATATLVDAINNLTLTGTEAINGTGNSWANTITGNSGDNILSGGAGADILSGGGGNDTFKGQGGNDTITLGAGTDTVVFESTKTLNGLDSVSGFSLAGGDKLDFNLFFGAATNISVLPTVNASSTGEVAVANGNVLQVNNDVGTITVDTIAAMFDPDLPSTFEAALTGEKFVVITAAATGNASVWYVNTASDGLSSDLTAEDVVQTVTLVGVNNLAVVGGTPLVADNIVA
jgi:Ca2+-binding RTX toxin-like protein